jgi:hypothetical protein
MARSRTTKPAATPAPASTDGQSSAALVCPECGKTFTRPASLGAHRRQAHGVAGTTHARTRRPARTRSRRPATTRTRSTTTSRPSAGVNRDALLGALFPDGIPPREELIRSVNAWLDEAERLAQAT